MNIKIDKSSFSGYLMFDKSKKNKIFFSEEEFLKEINQMLLLINDNSKFEVHKFHQGICLKLKSSNPNKDKNEIELQIVQFIKKFFNYFKNI